MQTTAVTGLQIATFVFAVLGFALALVVFGWQILSFLLTRGRVRVELLIGAKHESSPAVHLQPADGVPLSWTRTLVEQRYTLPIVAVRVRNVGRLQVTVENFAIVSTARIPRDGMLGSLFKRRKNHMYWPAGDHVGPTLPHKLEVGASEVWMVRATVANELVLNMAGEHKVSPDAITVCGRVDLGDGRSHRTRGQFTL